MSGVWAYKKRLSKRQLKTLIEANKPPVDQVTIHIPVGEKFLEEFDRVIKEHTRK